MSLKDELELAVEDLIKHDDDLVRDRKVKSVLKKFKRHSMQGCNPPRLPRSPLKEFMEELNHLAKKQREKEALERKNRKRYLRPVE